MILKTYICVIDSVGVGFAAEGDFIERRIGTPYGPSPNLLISSDIAYLPISRKKLNEKAVIWALNSLDVKRILAIEDVGSLDPHIEVGDLVTPSDGIDFSNSAVTFKGELENLSMPISTLFCPEIQNAIRDAVGKNSREAIYINTSITRYETPAEAEFFQKIGGGVAGNLAFRLANLAKELGICYGSITVVTRKLGRPADLSDNRIKAGIKKIRESLYEILDKIPKYKNCSCYASVLE